MHYDAFISYGHDTDFRLAEAIQGGLQRFAKPWYRRRSLSVFRDSTGLSTNTGLWSSITEVMESSDYFVVLCSPDSADSPWVGREIDHWCATKPAGRILPVLTAGELVWDDATGTFDPQLSTAADPALARAFVEEPLYVDFRWAHTDDHLTLRNPGFRDNVADLAAPMHGVAKDELIGEDIRQHRRTLRFAWGAVIALLILALGTIAGATVAVRNANEVLRVQGSLDDKKIELATATKKLDKQLDLLADAEDDVKAANDEADASAEKADKANADATTSKSEAASAQQDATRNQKLASKFQAEADVNAREAGNQKLAAAVAKADALKQGDLAHQATLDLGAAVILKDRAEAERRLANEQRKAAVAARKVADGKAAAATRVATGTRLATDSANAQAAGELDLALLLAKESTLVQPAAANSEVSALADTPIGSVVPAARGALLSAVQEGNRGLRGYLHFSDKNRPQALGKVAVSPDGHYVAAVEDSFAIESGAPVARLFLWHDAADPARATVVELAHDLHCVTDLQWTQANILVTVEAPLGCLEPAEVFVDSNKIGYSVSQVQYWDAVAAKKVPILDRWALAATIDSPVAVSPGNRFVSVSYTTGSLDDPTPLSDNGGPVVYTVLIDAPSLRLPFAEQRWDIRATRSIGFAFSPSGKLATGWDWLNDQLAVWHLTDWIEPSVICEEGCFPQVAAENSNLFLGATFGPIGPDGSEEVFAANVVDQASGSDTPHVVEVFDSSTGALRLTRAVPDGVAGITLTGDEMVISDISGNVHFFNWRNDGPEDTIKANASPGCESFIDFPTVGKGDRLLFLERHCLSGSDQPSVVVVDRPLRKITRELRGNLVFSSVDDRYVVVEQLDTSFSTVRWGIELWDFAPVRPSGALLASRTDARPRVSPDGTVVVGYQPFFSAHDEAEVSIWRLGEDGASRPETLPGSLGSRDVAFLGAHDIVGVGTMGSAIEWSPDRRPYEVLFDDRLEGRAPTLCDTSGAANPDTTDTRLRSVVSPDGRRRAMSRDSLTITSINLATGASRKLPDLGLMGGERIDFMSFAPDGRSLIVNIETPSESSGSICKNGDPRGSVIVPLSGGAAPTRLPERAISVNAGQRLLFATLDGSTLLVRDAVSLALVSSIRTERLGPDPTPNSAGNLYTIEPSGARVAGTNATGKTVVWSAADGNVVAGPFEPKVEATASVTLHGIRFSPDGRHLAVKAVDQTLRIYDLDHPTAVPQTQQLPSSAAARIVYSPDGSLIAVDGILILDASTLGQVGPRLKPTEWTSGTDFGVQAMRFVSDSKTGALYLVAERSDSTAAVRWRLDLEGLQEQACRLAGRPLTDAERSRYLGDAPQHTCPARRV